MTDNTIWRVTTRDGEGVEREEWVRVAETASPNSRIRWTVRGRHGAVNAATPELGILALYMQPLREMGAPLEIPVAILRPGEHSRGELLAHVEQLAKLVDDLGGQAPPLVPFSAAARIVDVLEHIATAARSDRAPETEDGHDG